MTDETTIAHLRLQAMRAGDATTELLQERGKTHGDFREHAEITQSLKQVMATARNWDRLTSVQREALEMVVHKIGRVLAGDPNFQDHYDDMAGYSRLVVEDLKRG